MIAVSMLVAGAVLEVLTGGVTAVGATVTAVTAATGDSFFIRQLKQGTRAFILNASAFTQATGVLQYRSVRLHDFTRNYRARHVAAQPFYITPNSAVEVKSQDFITFELSGSAVAGDIDLGTLYLYSEDIEGIRQRLITVQQLQKFSVPNRLCTVEVQIVSIANATIEYEEVVLTQGSNLLHANTDYAVLGFLSDQNASVITLRGTDTGNVRVGLPGHSTNKDVNRTGFVDFSKESGRGMIPVINSANQGNTFVGIVANENATTYNVTVILQELYPPSVSSAPSMLTK